MHATARGQLAIGLMVALTLLWAGATGGTGARSSASGAVHSPVAAVSAPAALPMIKPRK
jgi:hypothetical protein